MTTDPLQVSTPAKVTTFAAVALSTICVAIAVFVIAAYATDSLGLRIPVANLWLSIILCLTGIALSGLALRGRGTWKEIASFAVPAVLSAIVALRYGMPGVYMAFFAAYVLYLIYRRWQTMSASDH